MVYPRNATPHQKSAPQLTHPSGNRVSTPDK
jgi:hypothetical protein